MNKTTKDLKLPTTITGSLPRPEWYTENLGARPFRDALRTRAIASSTRTPSALTSATRSAPASTS